MSRNIYVMKIARGFPRAGSETFKSIGEMWARECYAEFGPLMFLPEGLELICIGDNPVKTIEVLDEIKEMIRAQEEKRQQQGKNINGG